ncbi:hypothetical protein BS636_05910 [Acinetobacter sp. LoGeW2-3]|uniref:hypothetical protein n=1 Tax=Acinetobacter sp. LoGeW2-3 TaxID=1808001 RepID=UPI000C059C9E|nr:hypothetical protein [Acinetobacter sp. LoGeW2-3]ATO19231.1 hypothetical protein BS636_05910 [Acinetobacter sp. LoGeW2-3]
MQNENINRIFVFWESQNNLIPAYLELCKQTWIKNIPNLELHIINYGNLDEYIGDIYDTEKLKKISLAMQSDIISAAVLEKFGGLFLDLDCIVTDNIFKVFDVISNYKLIGFGNPSTNGLHLAVLYSKKKNNPILKGWREEAQKRLENLPEVYKWNYFGNGILENLLNDERNKEHFLIIDRTESGNILESAAMVGATYENAKSYYRNFYFNENFKLNRKVLELVTFGIISLHNSWTPKKYKEVYSISDFLDCSIPLSGLLKDVLSGHYKKNIYNKFYIKFYIESILAPLGFNFKISLKKELIIIDFYNNKARFSFDIYCNEESLFLDIIFRDEFSLRYSKLPIFKKYSFNGNKARILNNKCIEEMIKSIIEINNSIAKHIDLIEKIDKKSLNLFTKTNNISFKDDLFFIEGIAFFEGLSCKNWSDIDYELHLRSEDENIILPLAKTHKTITTKIYSKDISINYDKANFCTKLHKGIDLSKIKSGKYVLKLKVVTLVKDEIVGFSYDFNEDIFSQSKRFFISKSEDDVVLNIREKSYIDEQVEVINKSISNKVKTWKFRENLIANHLDIKGFTFICDVEFFQDINTIKMSFFNKEEMFSDLITSHFTENKISHKKEMNKIICQLNLRENLDKFPLLIESFFLYVEKKIKLETFYKELEYYNFFNIDRLKKKKKKVIGFFVSDYRKWNLGDFFSILKNSKIYIPKIILLKEKTVPNTEDSRYIEQLNYFKSIDEDLILRENFTHSAFSEKILKDIDVIFYQQPWDGMAYWVQKFHKNILSCYIPYSYIIYKSHLDYSVRGFHCFIWKYFAHTTQHISTYLSYEENHADKLEVIGYPKLDVYQKPIQSKPFAEKFGNLSKKKIIYAPHHSFNGSALQIGTFQWNGDFIKELKEQENSLWCLKPHGRFRYSVISHQIMTEIEIDDYLQSWEEKNSFIYDRGDYFDLFRDSDILITDCSSFLAEYFPTGNPIIWLKSANSKVEFNDFGQYISQGFYIVNNLEELKNIYKKLVIDNVDPLKDIRHEIISQVFQNEESSSEKLYNIINEYLDSEV